eukprot:3576757-Rhodomonas_salina.1
MPAIASGPELREGPPDVAQPPPALRDNPARRHTSAPDSTQPHINLARQPATRRPRATASFLTPDTEQRTHAQQHGQPHQQSASHPTHDQNHGHTRKKKTRPDTIRNDPKAVSAFALRCEVGKRTTSCRRGS